MGQIGGKTVVVALERYAVEEQDDAVHSSASLPKRSTIGDASDKGLVAGNLQKYATRAIVHPVMTLAVSSNMLNGKQWMSSIASGFNVVTGPKVGCH